MKSVIIILTIAINVFSFNAFSQTPVITAEVNGDTVNISETGAYRNCGAFYMMEINLLDHQIDWYQLDTGQAAFCYCTFDLSVIYASLEPGDYTVNVYYTESWLNDTVFDGSTFFTIGNVRYEPNSGIISQYQSDCYTGIASPAEETIEFRIFPVPIKDGDIMNIEVDKVNINAILEIFSINGRSIFTRKYTNIQSIRDCWTKEELFPSPGIYFVRLTLDENVCIKKITVL